MRDKIIEIIREAYLSDPTWHELEHEVNKMADEILDLFPPLDGIEVEEECPKCWGSNDCVDAACKTCQGTGTITRPAAWGAVMEWIKETLEIVEGHEMYKFIGVMKSGGRLRIR